MGVRESKSAALVIAAIGTAIAAPAAFATAGCSDWIVALALGCDLAALLAYLRRIGVVTGPQNAGTGNRSRASTARRVGEIERGALPELQVGVEENVGLSVDRDAGPRSGVV